MRAHEARDRLWEMNFAVFRQGAVGFDRVEIVVPARHRCPKQREIKGMPLADVRELLERLAIGRNADAFEHAHACFGAERLQLDHAHSSAVEGWPAKLGWHDAAGDDAQATTGILTDVFDKLAEGGVDDLARAVGAARPLLRLESVHDEQ